MSPLTPLRRLPGGVLCAVAGVTLFPLAPGSRAQTVAPASQATYTVTLPKRNLRLPPFATKSLPDQVTLRLAVTVADAGGGGTTLRAASAPGSDLFADATLTRDSGGVVTSCRIVFGPRPVGNETAYQARIEAVPSGEGVYRLILPAQQGASRKSGAVIHPLSAQMFLGRQYDFRRGGAQTFGLLLDWEGDALNPATDLATLRLEAAGEEKIVLEDGPATARKLAFSVSGAGHIPEKKRAGFFYVGPRGEILQASKPNLFGIPFDDGKARGPAGPDPEKGGAVLRTTNGETIRARREGDGYEVALYGKPAAPFAVATLDDAFRLTRVKETWNGRSRFAEVTPTEVRYRFTESTLEAVAGKGGGVLFWPQLFATDTWEGKARSFAGMQVGDTREGSYVPLLTNGAGWGSPARFERLPDVPPALLKKAGVDGGGGSVRHYRLTGTGGDRFSYSLYTDGVRLLVLLGDDGLAAIRDGWQSLAAAVRPPDKTAPRPAR